MKIPITWLQLGLIITITLVIYYSVIGFTALKRKIHSRDQGGKSEPRTTRRKWQVNEETTSDEEEDNGIPEQYSEELPDDFDDEIEMNEEVTEEKLFSALEKLAADIETTFNNNDLLNDRPLLLQVLAQHIATYPMLAAAPYKNAITNLVTRKFNEHAIVIDRLEILSLWSE